MLWGSFLFSLRFTVWPITIKLCIISIKINTKSKILVGGTAHKRQIVTTHPALYMFVFISSTRNC